MTTRKTFTFFLWCLGLGAVLQGCRTEYIREHVTIQLNGQPIELQFYYPSYEGKNFLKKVLEILETEKKIDPKTGKKIDINDSRVYRTLPLNMAIDYAMTGRWRGLYDKNAYSHFCVAEYLLVKGADPNQKDLPKGDRQDIVMHKFCRLLGDNERNIDIQGMTLFLSYGAQLGVANKVGKTPIDIIKDKKPWIPKTMRRDDGWAVTTQALNKDLKKIYFTDVAEKLLELPQHREKVDEKFLKYLQEIGVDNSLIGGLRGKTLKTD